MSDSFGISSMSMLSTDDKWPDCFEADIAVCLTGGTGAVHN